MLFEAFPMSDGSRIELAEQFSYFRWQKAVASPGTSSAWSFALCHLISPMRPENVWMCMSLLLAGVHTVTRCYFLDIALFVGACVG